MIDYCLFAYHNSRIYQWTENEISIIPKEMMVSDSHI